MGITNNGIYTLDPSCFSTLGRLTDTLKALDSLRAGGNLYIYIPKIIYDIVILEPAEKFRRLPEIIEDWIDKEEGDAINQLNKAERTKYVSIMRTILEKFEPHSFSFIDEGDDKIGENSIKLFELIKNFGKNTGSIIFEVIASSVNLKSIIISFGKKTSDHMRRFGSKVVEAHSKFKEILKKKSGVKRGLNIMQCVMSLNLARQFLETTQTNFDIESLAGDSLAIASLGLLIVGNG
jgi:hypothetical protein